MAYFLLFPGQGAQRPGMLGDLTELTAVQRTLEAAENILDLPLGKWMAEGPAAELTRTEHAQPALLALGVGVGRAMLDAGIEIAGAAGHSLGEITALTLAEAIPFGDAVRLTHLRGRAMQNAVPEGQGAMVAVLGMPDEALAGVLAAGSEAGVVTAANHNAPGNVVLSGDRAAVEAGAAAAKAAGARKAIPLKVSAPFHCELMAPAAAELAEFLAAVELQPPGFPVWSNARIAPHDTDGDAIRAALVEQVTAPVRWVDQVRTMNPAHPGLEVAPAGVLKGLCRRILPSWSVAELKQREHLESLAA